MSERRSFWHGAIVPPRSRTPFARLCKPSSTILFWYWRKNVQQMAKPRDELDRTHFDEAIGQHAKRDSAFKHACGKRIGPHVRSRQAALLFHAEADNGRHGSR